MNNIKLFFKGFKKGFKSFSHIISDTINYALLSIVYLLGVGLTSLLSKIFNKHFLNLKNKKRKTYWKTINLKKEPIEKYYKQF